MVFGFDHFNYRDNGTRREREWPFQLQGQWNTEREREREREREDLRVCDVWVKQRTPYLCRIGITNMTIIYIYISWDWLKKKKKDGMVLLMYVIRKLFKKIFYEKIKKWLTFLLQHFQILIYGFQK